MRDEEAIRLLHSMVGIQSISGHEARVAKFLVNQMVSLGFEAHVDDAGNAIGTIGSGERSIVLAGHIDTVPGDLPVYIEDGILYGRGAVDAKGPMACFVAAAARYAADNPTAMKITVVGCTEEEAPTSAGARHAAETVSPPDFLVVGEPSGWDGITIGYKGYVRAKLRLKQDVTHTAHDVTTVSAEACNVWQTIDHAAERYNEGKERAYDRLLTTLIRIECENDGVEDHATLDVSLRLPEEMPPKDAEEWLRSHARHADVTILGALPAWSGPRTTPLHRALARSIRANGGNPTYKLKTGTADLNILAPLWGCPSLAYGPGEARFDHTPDEQIRIEEFTRGVAVLTDALKACEAADVAASRPAASVEAPASGT